MGLFDKRTEYKPFEYPEVMQFVKMMNNTFWVHEEVDFTADIQDFKTKLNEKEKEVIKRSLLGIAQVEVAVKSFWGDLYKVFPKPEINGLGATLAESEFRHSEAYARLLEVLGYNQEFKTLLNIPIFKEKLDLVQKNLSSSNISNKLLFFTIIIENASLFSQFANLLSFTRFKGMMKNVSNIIAWTSVDEQIHAQAGIFLLNKLKEEGHISKADEKELVENVKIFIELEERFLDWIYEQGELSFFTKEDMINFMKKRVDDSLYIMKMEQVFNITPEQYKPMKWYDEEIMVTELDDFFAKRPTAYTKHNKSITINDLF